jgi:hypothetical protein
MGVANFIKEVDLLLFEHESGCYRVNRSITPSFIEEATVMIQRIEIIDVFRRPQPLKATDFEIGPLKIVSVLIHILPGSVYPYEVTLVISFTAIIAHKPH